MQTRDPIEIQEGDRARSHTGKSDNEERPKSGIATDCPINLNPANAILQAFATAIDPHSFEQPAAKQPIVSKRPNTAIIGSPRVNEPKGIVDMGGHPLAKLSHSNTVLEALATALDPQMLEKQLDPAHIGGESKVHAPKVKGKSGPAEWEKCIRRAHSRHTFNPIREFFGILRNLRGDPNAQEAKKLPKESTFKLQCGFHVLAGETDKSTAQGKNYEDAVLWLNRMLCCLAQGYNFDDVPNYSAGPNASVVESLFQLQWHKVQRCQREGIRTPLADSQGRQWFLNLEPPSTHHALTSDHDRDATALAITPEALLKLWHQVGESKEGFPICQKCVPQLLTLLTALPQHLILRFERQTTARHKRMNEKLAYEIDFGKKYELNLKDFVEAKQDCEYQLQSVIYHIGNYMCHEDSKYIVVTRVGGANGTWYQCDGSNIQKNQGPYLHSDDGGFAGLGQPYLAFYERISTTKGSENLDKGDGEHTT